MIGPHLERRHGDPFDPWSSYRSFVAREGALSQTATRDTSLCLLAGAGVPETSLGPRRMTLLCDRWSVDKRTAISEAWFNGIGVVNWQNVWGM